MTIRLERTALIAALAATMFQHTMDGTLDSDAALRCDRLRDALLDSDSVWVDVDVVMIGPEAS